MQCRSTLRKTHGLNEDDTIKFKKEYKDLCRTVKGLVEDARADFYAQKIQECDGDQKKLKVINCLMEREKPKALPTSSSNHVLVETINDFYFLNHQIHEELNALKSTTVECLFEFCIPS